MHGLCRRFATFLAAAAGLALAPAGSAASLAERLARELNTVPVLILGEQHYRPESPPLAADIADAYLRNGACLNIALEIDVGRQGWLDRWLYDAPSADDVAVLDGHPAFVLLLTRLRDLQEQYCLRVLAVDAPPPAYREREAYMTERVVGLSRDAPTLVLVGNLHAFKRVRWQGGAREPFLAERLKLARVEARSVLQAWRGDCFERDGELLTSVDADTWQEAAEIAALVSAHPPADGAEATDGMVLWNCR